MKGGVDVVGAREALEGILQPQDAPLRDEVSRAIDDYCRAVTRQAIEMCEERVEGIHRNLAITSSAAKAIYPERGVVLWILDSLYRLRKDWE